MSNTTATSNRSTLWMPRGIILRNEITLLDEKLIEREKYSSFDHEFGYDADFFIRLYHKCKFLKSWLAYWTILMGWHPADTQWAEAHIEAYEQWAKHQTLSEKKMSWITETQYSAIDDQRNLDLGALLPLDIVIMGRTAISRNFVSDVIRPLARMWYVSRGYDLSKWRTAWRRVLERTSGWQVYPRQ